MQPRKIIFIGACRLEVNFSGAQPVSAVPGGNMLNAAIMLGTNGVPVDFVGEAATDHPGNRLVDTLAAAGVNTDCIDRFPDGATTICMRYDSEPEGVIYTKSPRESLVIKWPKVGANDIVVFGNWFALDPRTRPAVMEFVEHAAQRGALLVYLPGFPRQLEPAITHVMPMILDNLELADVVMTFNRDYADIFGASDAEASFKRNISFYSELMIHAEVKAVHLFHVNNARTFDVDMSGASALADFLAYLAGVPTADAKSLISHISSWNPIH